MAGPASTQEALARVRAEVLAPDRLVRAVAAGRRKGQERPPWRRVELRWVDLRAGTHLQVTAYDETQAHTSNHAAGAAAEEALDALLAAAYGNWHVDTTAETIQLRVTKKGDALLHARAREGAEAAAPVDRSHDREKQRMLPADDPVFRAVGIADADGRVKPSRQAKYRQVEELLRALDVAVTDALAAGHLRRPTPEEPLRVADLGCGNAYLTFAVARFLTDRRDLPTTVVGVDVKQQSGEHFERVRTELGVDARFVVGTIGDAVVDPAPEVVLALHACDTATDEALARAVEWDATLVLAAPCCHHDVAAQLRRAPTPAPYAALTRHGILRERLADTLTDGLRADLMRVQGYRVDVMEFVDSKHTPRNTLLRAVRTGAPDPGGAVRASYDELVGAWGLTPRLAVLLGLDGPVG